MKKATQKRFWKFMTILAIGFLIIFIFRVIYDQTNKSPQIPIGNPMILLEKSFELEDRRNYASIKYQGPDQSSSNLDQKYEKIANINAVSNQFDIDEAQVRDEIKKLKGLIQFENKNGNEGHRRLEVVIGVPPESFDSLFQNLVKIGNVQSKEITKKDKTNEYRELQAKKLSLEKTRASLIDLKSKGGKINEYMLLENRILDIEQQLQELGVSLGSFDAENEFCTINFTLTERAIIQIGFIQHMANALEWTVIFYMKLLAIGVLMSLFAYLTLSLIEKTKTNN
ncbi:MAG: DUF4349 domain-containing protein [Bacteroidota bacterium]